MTLYGIMVQYRTGPEQIKHYAHRGTLYSACEALIKRQLLDDACDLTIGPVQGDERVLTDEEDMI